jgi:hypothetical protein
LKRCAGRWPRAAAAGALVAAGLPWATACTLQEGDGQQVSGAGGVQLAWQAQPSPIRNGQPFVLAVRLCPAGATLKGVDATMPAHRHGMNYRPSLHPLGEGRWRVDGMLWHMAGAWELRFDVEVAGVRHSLRQAVELR